MGFFDFIFGKRAVAEPAPMSQLAEVAAKFSFPVTAVRGDEVEAEILRLRQEARPNSTAIIVGDYEHGRRLLDLWEEPFDAATELERTSALDVPGWFAQRQKEDAQYFDHEAQAEIHGSGTAPMTRLTVGYDFKNRPVPEVFIATVPTADSTSLPVHLRFGEWNACPSAHVHVALARYWRERYGAELVTLSSDILEFTVARPPADEQQATELALQHYLYCNDIVDQGVGSVATLARALRHSTRWYFWWD